MTIQRHPTAKHGPINDKPMANQCGRGNKMMVIQVGNSNNVMLIDVEQPASPLQTESLINIVQNARRCARRAPSTKYAISTEPPRLGQSPFTLAAA